MDNNPRINFTQFNVFNTTNVICVDDLHQPQIIQQLNNTQNHLNGLIGVVQNQIGITNQQYQQQQPQQPPHQPQLNQPSQLANPTTQQLLQLQNLNHPIMPRNSKYQTNSDTNFNDLPVFQKSHTLNSIPRPSNHNLNSNSNFNSHVQNTNTFGTPNFGNDSSLNTLNLFGMNNLPGNFSALNNLGGAGNNSGNNSLNSSINTGNNSRQNLFQLQNSSQNLANASQNLCQNLSQNQNSTSSNPPNFNLGNSLNMNNLNNLNLLQNVASLQQNQNHQHNLTQNHPTASTNLETNPSQSQIDNTDMLIKQLLIKTNNYLNEQNSSSTPVNSGQNLGNSGQPNFSNLTGQNGSGQNLGQQPLGTQNQSNFQKDSAKTQKILKNLLDNKLLDDYTKQLQFFQVSLQTETQALQALQASNNLSSLLNSGSGSSAIHQASGANQNNLNNSASALNSSSNISNSLTQSNGLLQDQNNINAKILYLMNQQEQFRQKLLRLCELKNNQQKILANESKKDASL